MACLTTAFLTVRLEPSSSLKLIDLSTVVPPRLRPGTASSTVPSIIEVVMRCRSPCACCEGRGVPDAGWVGESGRALFGLPVRRQVQRGQLDRLAGGKLAR